jgi:Dolichyl-phosphate-mannose-protein mannosyltransferase
MICVLVIPSLFLLCNPFVEIGINDDWSYVRMARVLAETGRLQYDGWTNAMVGPHAVWGMAFIKLFGFSFSTLRASMIPIAMGCSVLIYCIARWIGLSRWMAVFGSLGVVLSPIFVPVATVFMTDVSALFLFLLSTYCAMRAADSTRRSAMLWLFVAALAGVMAGSVRQIMWGAPILMIGSFIYIRRKDRVLLVVSAVMLLIMAFAVISCLHWLSSQLYSHQEKLHLSQVITGFRRLGFMGLMVLTLALFCMPVLMYLIGTRRVWRGATWDFVGAIGLTAFAAVRSPILVHAPWIGNVVTKFGLLSPNEVVVGDQPVILSEPVCYIAGTIVLLCLIFAGITVIRLYRVWNAATSSRESVPGGNRLAIFGWMTLPNFIAYLALLVLRSDGFVTDRYLLPLLAVATIAILAVAARLPGARLTVLPWLCLLLIGSYSVAITRDAFRMSEARARATDRLRQRGIARECIMGGYEYDGWTELDMAGYIKYPDKLPPRNTPLDYYFFQWAPHVKPKYYVVLSLQNNLPSAAVLDVPYSTWLAPRRRHVFVQVDPRASCSTLSGPNAVKTEAVSHGWDVVR